MIDIWYMVIFGVVGYVFKKLDYPLAPLVLALVLGDLAENALRQSLIMSQGSLAIFVARPISGAITAVAILFFALPVLTPWWRRLRGVPAVVRPPRGGVGGAFPQAGVWLPPLFHRRPGPLPSRDDRPVISPAG